LRDAPPLRSIEIGIDDVQIDQIRTCFQIWEKWCGDGSMPIWKGGSCLMDLPAKVMPFTMIADVVQSPLDFVYRFWGSGLSRLHGYDLTGQSARMLHPPEFADLVFTSYKNVWEQKAPTVYIGETVSKGNVVTVEHVLRMPLTTDGVAVDKIMAIAWIDMKNAGYWSKITTDHRAEIFEHPQ